METEKLYYADPFLTEFDARVLACEAVKDGFAVVLDRTAFYPEGGGQPYDTGVLGGAEVLDVHERAGVITHKCASPLPVGAAVHGKIDRARRFDHMQQHSGEHICSGLICARYGCDNVGFHMGAESVTIDFIPASRAFSKYLREPAKKAPVKKTAPKKPAAKKAEKAEEKAE